MPINIPNTLTLPIIQSTLSSRKNELIKVFVSLNKQEGKENVYENDKVTPQYLRQAFFIAALHENVDNLSDNVAGSLNKLVNGYNGKDNSNNNEKSETITTDQALEFIFIGEIPESKDKNKNNNKNKNKNNDTDESSKFYQFICKKNYLLRLVFGDGNINETTSLLGAKGDIGSIFPNINTLDKTETKQRFCALRALYQAIGDDTEYYTKETIDLLAKLPESTLQDNEFTQFLKSLLKNKDFTKGSGPKDATKINTFFLDPDIVNCYGIKLFGFAEKLTTNILLSNKQKILGLANVIDSLNGSLEDNKDSVNAIEIQKNSTNYNEKITERANKERNNSDLSYKQKNEIIVKAMAQIIANIACTHQGSVIKETTESMSNLKAFLKKNTEFADFLGFENVDDKSLRKFAFTGDAQSNEYNDSVLINYYKNDSNFDAEKKSLDDLNKLYNLKLLDSKSKGSEIAIFTSLLNIVTRQI